MPKVFLLISKIGPEFTRLLVKCAVCGDSEDARTIDREFATPRDLEDALLHLGVSEYESEAAHQVFVSGQCTFIPVSSEVATKLGVLDWKGI